MWSTHDQPLETLRMRIGLPSEIPRPEWPEGSHVRGLPLVGCRASSHALLEHGYQRGGGSVEAFGAWLPALTGDSEFDPQLCFLVEVGDDLAAAAICWSSAFVDDLVVRTGGAAASARALLRIAFEHVPARGASHVELKVQAQNAPAIRLYERVGMRTVERITEQPGTDCRLAQAGRACHRSR